MEMHHEQANPKNAVVSDVLPLQSGPQLRLLFFFFAVMMKWKYLLNCKLLLSKPKMHNEGGTNAFFSHFYLGHFRCGLD